MIVELDGDTCETVPDLVTVVVVDSLMVSAYADIVNASAAVAERIAIGLFRMGSPPLQYSLFSKPRCRARFRHEPILRPSVKKTEDVQDDDQAQRNAEQPEKHSSCHS
jgi:hypothetical protein